MHRDVSIHRRPRTREERRLREAFACATPALYGSGTAIFLEQGGLFFVEGEIIFGISVIVSHHGVILLVR